MKYLEDFNLDVSSFNKPTSSGIVNDYPIFTKPIPKISTNKDPFNIGFPEINFGDPVRLGDPQIQIDNSVLKNTTPFNPVIETKNIFTDILDFVTPITQTKKKRIKSQIIDEDGLSVPYATVVVVNDNTNYVESDDNGFFEIIVSENDSLKINMVGYDSFIIPVKNIGNQILLKQGSEGELPGISLKLKKDKPNYWLYGGIGLGVLAVGYLVFSKPKTSKKAGLKGAKKTIHVTL